MNDNDETMSDIDEIKTGKFIKGFGNTKLPITMIFGVSMGNEKQSGNDLISFVNLINSHAKKSIIAVEIMVADYLHRHYSTEEEAQTDGDNWIKENENILKGLKVPYTIVRWKDIIQEQKFKEAQIKIAEHYQKDASFKAKVQNVARSHTDKGDFPVVEKYLLEECAYFIYKNGYLTYPAQKLNSACMHVIQKYNNDLLFLPYCLNGRKKSDEFKTQQNHAQPQTVQPMQNIISTSNTSSYLGYVSVPRVQHATVVQPSFCYPEELVVGCGQLSLLMQKHGITKVEQREQFFSQYLKSVQPCINMMPVLICDESSTEIARSDNYVQETNRKVLGVNN